VGGGEVGYIEKVGFSLTSRALFGGWQASLTDTLRCVSHKIDDRLPSVASHTGQQYLCYAASGLNKHVTVSATLAFATPPAAYANTLRPANFYIILNNYAICASAHGSSRPAGRIIQIMQKSAGSVPRPALLSGVLCGRYAVCLCRVAASATAKAQAHKSASGYAARARHTGC